MARTSWRTAHNRIIMQTEEGVLKAHKLQVENVSARIVRASECKVCSLIAAMVTYIGVCAATGNQAAAEMLALRRWIRGASPPPDFPMVLSLKKKEKDVSCCYDIVFDCCHCWFLRQGPL